MNKTTNYQLNQWERADRVLMEDFNADNAKIDAAIKAVDGKADSLSSGKADKTALESVRQLALRSRFTKLWETTTTANGTVEVNMSGIDWSKWDKVHLDFEPVDSSQIRIRVNEISNTLSDIPLYTSSRLYRFTFYPGFRPDRPGYMTCLPEVYGLGVLYSNFKKLVFLSTEAGAHFELWGEV